MAKRENKYKYSYKFKTLDIACVSMLKEDFHRKPIPEYEAFPMSLTEKKRKQNEDMLIYVVFGGRLGKEV